MEENNHKIRPWELITSALQGELAPEEEQRLQAWLAESTGNQEEFERLQRLWKEGVADYPRYLEADETRAWSDLQSRLDPAPAPRIGWRRWAVAIAAVFIITTGLGVLGYFLRLAHPVQYETAANEKRTIALPDGTMMNLDGVTHVRIDAGYNQSGRSVTLLRGKVRFDVVHEAQKPFTVNAGTVVIRDIGTSFTVTMANDSVDVEVISGKVSVADQRTRQTFALDAGQVANNYSRSETHLKFQNALLSSVLDALQKYYGKTVLLKDTSLATKRLTVNLEGESLEEAIKVICASLDLNSHADSNGYVLSKATR